MATSARRITVLLAGESDLLRVALPSLLRGDERFCIVGEAGSDAALIAQRLQPDLTVVDPGTGGRPGLAAIEGLRQAAPGSRIAVFTRRFDLRSYVAAMHAGILGYFLPSFATLGRPFLDMLEGVGRWGCGITDPTSAARFQAACGTSLQLHEPGELAGKLTPRQEEILRLFLQGLNEQEMATRLHVTASTAAGHVAEIHRRLGTTNPYQVGWLLRDRGLL